ncbi:MAG: phosphoglycerate kinase [bacterium]
MQLKSIETANVTGKRILMRVDYNVSLGRTLKVVDDTRIRHTIPTIEYLLAHQVKSITLIAHFGKPAGVVDPAKSLSPVAAHLSELLGEPVAFNIPGKISLLENLRFDSREEEGSEEFARELAKDQDIYVNEAFGESHRDATSITYLPKILPSFAGFGLIEEVNTILKNLESPTRPFVVIIGGAKVKDKIGLLEVLSLKADIILIGGGMANTFLAARSVDIKNSLVEKDKIGVAEKLLEGGVGKARIILPSDYVWDNDRIVDIGPNTRQEFARVIASGKTIIWNGPMGIFEDSRFALGTDSIYEALTSNEPAMVIVGGGDTLTAIKDHTHLERIDFISTGGGAMLELIEKGTLPALIPLTTS